jgi:hypothetical protein
MVNKMNIVEEISNLRTEKEHICVCVCVCVCVTENLYCHRKQVHSSHLTNCRLHTIKYTMDLGRNDPLDYISWYTECEVTS